MDEKYKILKGISGFLLTTVIGLLVYDIANGIDDKNHIISYWTLASSTLTLLLSVIVLWAYIIISKSKTKVMKNKKSKITKKQIKILENLSDKEREYLRKHISQNRPEITYTKSDSEDGILHNLVLKNILKHPMVISTGS